MQTPDGGFPFALKKNNPVALKDTLNAILRMDALGILDSSEAEKAYTYIIEIQKGHFFYSGENIYLYIEPVGYKMKKSNDGHNEFGFTADYSLVNEEGKMMAGQENFADLHFRSWNFNTEISITFTYTFSGFEKGKYKVITTVKDKFSSKKSTVENWFSFR